MEPVQKKHRKKMHKQRVQAKATSLGFAPRRKRHILEQVFDEHGKPVENSYICITCEKE